MLSAPFFILFLQWCLFFYAARSSVSLVLHSDALIASASVGSDISKTHTNAKPRSTMWHGTSFTIVCNFSFSSNSMLLSHISNHCGGIGSSSLDSCLILCDVVSLLCSEQFLFSFIFCFSRTITFQLYNIPTLPNFIICTLKLPRWRFAHIDTDIWKRGWGSKKKLRLKMPWPEPSTATWRDFARSEITNPTFSCLRWKLVYFLTTNELLFRALLWRFVWRCSSLASGW